MGAHKHKWGQPDYITTVAIRLAQPALDLSLVFGELGAKHLQRSISLKTVLQRMVQNPRVLVWCEWFMSTPFVLDSYPQM